MGTGCPVTGSPCVSYDAPLLSTEQSGQGVSTPGRVLLARPTAGGQGGTAQLETVLGKGHKLDCLLHSTRKGHCQKCDDPKSAERSPCRREGLSREGGGRGDRGLAGAGPFGGVGGGQVPCRGPVSPPGTGTWETAHAKSADWGLLRKLSSRLGLSRTETVGLAP